VGPVAGSVGNVAGVDAVAVASGGEASAES
jgi:hypothetical protein